MRQGFRPQLVPPKTHCHAAVTDTQRPVLCLVVTLVVVLMVATIFGMSAWNVFNHKFGENTFDFYGDDEVALSHAASDFSATFCDSYRVSLQGAGQAFLLSHPATVNTSYLDNVIVDIRQLPYREFNVEHQYLLQKSLVNVTACRRGRSIFRDAEIVLIQGDKNFLKWRRNVYCSDCTFKRVHIPEDAFCGETRRHLPRLYHEVESADRYFLLVFNGRAGSRPHFLSLGIHLSGIISKTHFDLSDTEKSCYMMNSSSCVFTLPWRSTNDVVVKIESPSSWHSRNSLRTHCQVRVVFWVCVFGILPLVCILLALASVSRFLCRKTVFIRRMRRGCEDEMVDERTRLLQDGNEQCPNYVPQNESNERMAIQFG